MKILALERERPDLTDADYAPHLTAEAAHLWRLVQAGVVREAYFRQGEHTAVLVLECASVDEARAVLAGLPLAAAGLIDVDLLSLVPYDGFARLFGPEGQAEVGTRNGLPLFPVRPGSTPVTLEIVKRLEWDG